jgi:hypothetical protein
MSFDGGSTTGCATTVATSIDVSTSQRIYSTTPATLGNAIVLDER